MTTASLIQIARTLSESVNLLHPSLPVTHTLNPLDYAWAPHEAYLRKFGNGKKRVIFMGMNPGPFGMVQVGVPFGEVNAVRDWMKIVAPVAQPKTPNPHRPIEGFDCVRSEISGQRLWALFSERFPNAEDFFHDHFVLNYCPLAFFDKARNVTPDKIPKAETAPLYAACDEHLRACVRALEPEWIIGIGKFAEAQARSALSGEFPSLKIGTVLHPSPASPMANRGWSPQAAAQLAALGLW
ncbi:MAG: single-stranded DNA-binding protein [Betaproteobacteria bacterium]|nr:MAG: single-stranded DNA-binding protein [Betaproteobacteria bacterium]